MKPTLIIVDDVAEIRAELRVLLQENFEIVAEAKDGAHAIEACYRHAPQLVLMDVVMPRMSGLEATYQILTGPEPHPKIVMLSGLKDESVVLKALEAGASDYLFKPADPKQVTQVLLRFAAEAKRS